MIVELDKRIRQELVDLYNVMYLEGKLCVGETLEKHYTIFRQTWRSEKLLALEGEALLNAMHGPKPKNESLMYWLEYKDDEEFNTNLFGHIGKGTAFKFGLFYKQGTNCWTTGHERKQIQLSVEQAIEKARWHRDQLVAGCKLIDELPEEGDDKDYERLQEEMYRLAVSNKSWSHKYFHLLYPRKLEDYHVTRYQLFHLIKILQIPLAPHIEGQYAAGGRYIAIARDLQMEVSTLTALLNKRNGTPPENWNVKSMQEVINLVEAEKQILNTTYNNMKRSTVVWPKKAKDSHQDISALSRLAQKQIIQEEWKDPINITKEQWMVLLEDREVVNEEDFRLLQAAHSCDGCEVRSAQLAQLLNIAHHASINSQVGRLGKRVAKKLDIQAPAWHHPEKYGEGFNWWNVPFWGEKRNGNLIYWILRPELQEAIRELEKEKEASLEITIPEEIDSDSQENLYEGTRKQIYVNSYERNRDARDQCVKHYGPQCVICGFDFEKTYGSVGKDVIHVHHLKPLSDIGEKYRVDPINDLRPVCPNCHVIIHRKDPPYSVAEVKAMITNA